MTDPNDHPAAEAPDPAESPPEAPEAALEVSRSVSPPSILSRSSDQAPRPGFRSPANQRTKAQRKKK